MCTLALACSTAADAAPLSSGIDRDSRLTVYGTEGVTATAAHGDTLYMAGVVDVGLRAPGLAVFDAAGALEHGHPELDGPDLVSPATAGDVVPDRAGGAYVVGVRGTGADGIPQPALLHVTAAGEVDTAFRPEFATAGGDASTDVRAVAVATDGTVYVGGGFARVGGVARDGLAALDPATGAPRPWTPDLTGVGSTAPAVERLALAGEQVLVAGAFTEVGGATRDGLAGIARADAAPTAWAPAGLDASAGASGLLVDGTTALLGSASALRSVTTNDQGSVRDLAVPAGGAINAIALGSGTAYVVGSFAAIDGAPRDGLAEVALSSGDPTGWDPGQNGRTGGTALAVDGDRVYVAIPDSSGNGPRAWGGATRCGVAAVARGTGALDSGWDASTSGATGCNVPPRRLAVSGGRVWAAGAFESTNLRSRSGLAAIDVATDTVLPWAPVLDDGAYVYDMEVTPDGRTLYAGGYVTTVNGVARNNAVAISTGPGAAGQPADVRAWDPDVTGEVYDVELAADVASVYLAGTFSAVGGSAHANLAVVDGATGADEDAWRPDTDSPVNDIELDGDGALYAGGGFTTIGGIGRRFLAKLPSGSDTPDPGWDAGIAPALTTTVNDLALDGDALYVGGEFDGVLGGQQRRNAVALRRADGGVVARWNPDPDGVVAAVTRLSDGTLLLIGGSPYSLPFSHLGALDRPGFLGSVTPDGTVTGWAPQTPTLFPAAPFYHPFSNDAQEVAGRTVVPGHYWNAPAPVFDGTPQAGILVFGTARVPATVAPPRVVGSAREGQQLSCAPGSYGRDPVSRSYAWLRGDREIAGVTGTRYLVQAEDRGFELACRETVENAAGRGSATSAPVRIAVARPSSSEPPEVAGAQVRVGVAVTCARGRWSDFPTSYAYQWRLDGSPIVGATAQAYTPTAGQQDRQLSCAVRAANDAGESDAAVSAGRAVAPAEQPPCTVNCGGDPPPRCIVNCGGGPPPGCTVNCGGGPPPRCTVNCGATPRPPSSTFTIASTSATASVLTSRLTLPGPGTLTVLATAKVGRRTISVGQTRTSVRGGGSVTVRVRLSSAAARALARQRGRRLPVSLTFTFTPTGGSAGVQRRQVVVRAARRAARRPARTRDGAGRR